MRIIFMGTPDFAVPSLQILHENGYDVVSVVTVPDKPAGRGRKLQASAVKQYADSVGIPVLQPHKLRDLDFLGKLQDLQPDLMVVVAFRMLPKLVWDIPEIGTFNLHGSLLPDYRGAAPINWVLINGEKETGLTTFMIDSKIDTGNLMLQEKVTIPFEWTAGDLHDHMMEVGAKLVLKTVQGLEAGELTAYPQDDSLFKNKAPKIFREDCQIDWNQPVEVVYNFVRGLSPYPAAWTEVDEKVLKIFRASIISEKVETPGVVRHVEETSRLMIACTDGWLEIEQLQLAGKKRMSTADFLRGQKDSLEGKQLESPVT